MKRSSFPLINGLEAERMSRLISILRRWLEPLGTALPTVYLVGGAVRDHLLGREAKDVDLMCADPQALAHALESVHGAALVPFLNKPDTPCLRVVNRADTEDFIDLVPIHGSGVADDLSRRDFTINAMAIEVGAGGALGELIDPLGGLRDLRSGLIRATGPDAMTSDPLRVIRAARFSAELGFKIDAATREMMSDAAERVAAVAAERIVRELFLTLNQPGSTPLVRVLDGTGALPAIFPEIAPMRGCLQNEYHHLNAWDHSLEALEKLEAVLASLSDQFEPVAGRLHANLERENRRSILKLATLLHDAGKPESRAVAPETGRVTFYGHDAAGSRIAEGIAARLKFSVRDQELFGRLIGDHMHMIGLSGRGVRPGTILRWFRRLGEDMILLLLLGMADVMATAEPASSEFERARRLRWCRETIRLYYTEIKDRLERKPLIGGRDLMAIGIPPGPGMGKIIEALRTAQDEGAVQNRDEALDLAVKLNRRME
jgi:tRNA nucleotidyltransferase/poly(A) polymerase